MTPPRKFTILLLAAFLLTRSPSVAADPEPFRPMSKDRACRALLLAAWTPLKKRREPRIQRAFSAPRFYRPWRRASEGSVFSTDRATARVKVGGTWYPAVQYRGDFYLVSSAAEIERRNGAVHRDPSSPKKFLELDGHREVLDFAVGARRAIETLSPSVDLVRETGAACRTLDSIRESYPAWDLTLLVGGVIGGASLGYFISSSYLGLAFHTPVPPWSGAIGGVAGAFSTLPVINASGRTYRTATAYPTPNTLEVFLNEIAVGLNTQETFRARLGLTSVDGEAIDLIFYSGPRPKLVGIRRNLPQRLARHPETAVGGTIRKNAIAIAGLGLAFYLVTPEARYQMSDRLREAKNDHERDANRLLDRIDVERDAFWYSLLNAYADLIPGFSEAAADLEIPLHDRENLSLFLRGESRDWSDAARNIPMVFAHTRDWRRARLVTLLARAVAWEKSKLGPTPGPSLGNLDFLTWWEAEAGDKAAVRALWEQREKKVETIASAEQLSNLDILPGVRTWIARDYRAQAKLFKWLDGRQLPSDPIRMFVEEEKLTPHRIRRALELPANYPRAEAPRLALATSREALEELLAMILWREIGESRGRGEASDLENLVARIFEIDLSYYPYAK